MWSTFFKLFSSNWFNLCTYKGIYKSTIYFIDIHLFLQDFNRKAAQKEHSS